MTDLSRYRGECAAVGLSGGVDSAVAALLLKRAGCEVIGVTMKQDPSMDCSDAKRVAEALEIPWQEFDLSREFEEHVMRPFAEAYLSGRTPNPCNLCNPAMKWGALRDCAISLGAKWIATGHYASLTEFGDGRRGIVRRPDDPKDQTYALYGLTREMLSMTIMPLSGMEKPEIRRLAAEAELPVAEKAESQDICFIPDGDYAAFVEKYGRPRGEGDFVLSDGRVIGRHRGIIHYTVGQRRGLGIAWSEPLFVLRIDAERNRVVLGTGEEVFSDRLTCGNLNWSAIDPPASELRVTARIRYGHRGAEAVVRPMDGGSRAEVIFSEPVRAITPGQAVVFYDEDLLLGGGIIE